MIDSLSTVTFLDAGPSVENDRYGQPKPGPDVATVVPGCTVFQTETSEPAQVGADQVVTGLTILVPYGTNASYTTRCLIGDSPQQYQVLGSPTQYQNPFTGHRSGGVVLVRLVQG